MQAALVGVALSPGDVLAMDLGALALVGLGVTTAQHQLVPAMARKWKQINKFVEVFAHAFEQSPLATRDPAQPVRVLDFGALPSHQGSDE